LHLVDRNDPFTEIVARKIIEVGATGVRDPHEISKIAIKRLGFLASSAVCCFRQSLWCSTRSEVFETTRDARKATAEVACGCEFCFDGLSRAVGSGQGAGSVGRAPYPVGYKYLGVLSVWGADKDHT
jgi:hypothetical protein